MMASAPPPAAGATRSPSDPEDAGTSAGDGQPPPLNAEPPVGAVPTPAGKRRGRARFLLETFGLVLPRPAPQPTSSDTAAETPPAARDARPEPEPEPEPAALERAINVPAPARDVSAAPAAAKRATKIPAPARDANAGSAAGAAGKGRVRARPVAPRHERPARSLLVPAVAVLAVGAAAFAGRLASDISVGAEGDPISSRAVEFVPPRGWHSSEAPSRVGGLRLEDTVAARDPRTRGLVVAGVLPGVIFPQRLGREVDGSALAPEGVRLGRLEAYRWRDLRAGGRRVTLVAAPTGIGAAVLACSGPAQAIRRCENAAATLDVPDAEPTDLDALTFYGDGLERTLARLGRRRTDGLDRLRNALSRAGQAAAGLRRAHRAAGLALHDLVPPAAAVDANASLGTELRGMASAYARLARAAAGGDRAAYRAAARAVRRSEAALQRALGRL
jgi:hypothetical protein